MDFAFLEHVYQVHPINVLYEKDPVKMLATGELEYDFVQDTQYKSLPHEI